MLDSVFLDVAIGLAFLFCLVSLAATAIRELIEGLTKSRAIMLERGIRELLGEGGITPGTVTESLTRIVYDHPQVAGLFTGGYPEKLVRVWNVSPLARAKLGSSLPSYIPSRNFANALLDHIVRGPFGTPVADAAPIDFPALQSALATLDHPRLQRIVLNAIDEGGPDLEQIRQKLERWYDSGMDRVSGWYKRETQAVLFAIGLVFAVVLNIDSIAIGQRLLVDKQWRDSLVAQAQRAAPALPPAATGNAASADPAVPLHQLEDALSANGFMIDAPLPEKAPRVLLTVPGLDWQVIAAGPLVAFFGALPGYLILAFATTLGAAFWFDLLNKLMVVRSTVKPNEKSGEEMSKDGAAPPPPPPPPLIEVNAPPANTPVVAAPSEPITPAVAAQIAAAPFTEEDHALLDIDPADVPREDDGLDVR